MPYPWEYSTPQSHTPPPPPPSSAASTHRHGARFYAHRIQESLQTRIAMFFCSIFLSLLFVAGLITFILWISLRPHRPRFYVTSFVVPGLAPGSDIHVSDIAFTVLDRNPNRNIGIFYDAVGAVLFYSDQRIGATPLLVPFYQPPKNSTTIEGRFGGETLDVGGRLRDGLEADVKRGRVRFRLELSGRIRFKVTTWDTHQHGIHVNCEVEVGADGLALPQSLNKRCPMYFD